MTDRTKNYLGWALIIGVLLVGVAAWRYTTAYQKSTSYATFAVSGDGRATVIPDIATFSFSVITEGGTNLGQLQTENTAKINKAIDFVKGQGIASEDIKTENYNVSPRYQSGFCRELCPPPSIVGYSISQGVRVKIRQSNFAKIGDLLSGVVAQGANNVSQLDFTLDDPASAENAARAEAISEARAKAKSVAKAAGISLGQLLAIEEGGNFGPEFYAKGYGMGGDMMVAAPATAPRVEPGSQEVNVTVTLRYEIN